MDFRFTPEQEAFRKEVHDFLSEELVPKHLEFWEESAENQAFHRKMALKLGEKGFLGMMWPKENGGQGRPRIDALIFGEELAYFGQPGWNRPGVSLIGPTILHFGNEEQKKEILPGIVSGRVFWCQGFSEPNAGSDLASIRTTAVEDGDAYIVNGQKIWTSFAHDADWIFFLARTDKELPRHKGLSYFIAPLDSPGITVRPIKYMSGYYFFCEVFFDDVRVPKKNMIDEKNRGWYVAMGTLADERSGIEYAGVNRRVLDELVSYVKETQSNGQPLSKQQLVRNRLAGLAIEVEACRLMAYRIAWLQDNGRNVEGESAMSKVFGSELMWRLAKAGMQILGPYGQLEPESRFAKLMGRVGREYMGSFGWITAVGTSEIMRNIIATRGLGLPR